MQLLQCDINQCEPLRVCTAVSQINCFIFTVAYLNSVNTFETVLLATLNIHYDIFPFKAPHRLVLAAYVLYQNSFNTNM